MSQKKVLAVLFASLLAGILAAQATAQQAASSSLTSVPAQSQPGAKLILGYRMLDWKANHIHDAAAAATQAETLRKLGCEVKTAQHDGHSDVQFRTVYWKSLALDSAEQLQQWKTWLETVGFDVIHGRVASSQQARNADGSHKEVVKYRLVNWRSQHIHQAAEIGQLTTLYRALACEVENLAHDGHTDLRYRCPEWMEIELPSHTAAHKWQEFLKKAGFETSHEH
jgi:hypothetical protein